MDTESKRLSLQKNLDQQKSKLERNRLGQYATPMPLAHEILSFSLNLMSSNASIRFLDPAFGTGSFYSALLKSIGNRQVDIAQGYEIDSHYGKPSQNLWSLHNLNLRITDFTRCRPPENGFNLLICNPPYVRHHHIDSSEKKRLQLESKRSTNIDLSGLSGLYCHFMAIAHAWLNEDGIACWLIPSEFMDVNYGQAIKKYLVENVTLLRIHRFDPTDVQFDDALVSSVVVCFKKNLPPQDHCVEFSTGGTLVTPKSQHLISLTQLSAKAKWTRISDKPGKPKNSTATLSDFFTIKRGLVTGNNDFFILSKTKIVELGLPLEFFKPILPSPRFLKIDEITSDAQGQPILPEPQFLLDCRLPEAEIKEHHPALWQYLETGYEVAKGYLCRSRTPWYRQEDRLPSPFLCTYMGRSNNPFRFILNHTSALVTNTYLMLYPKPFLTALIHDKPSLVADIWESLRQIPSEDLIREGRVYGGGLYKIEPKELSRVSASAIIEKIT